MSRAFARGTDAPTPSSSPVCPRCRAMLVGRLIDGLHVETCAGCQGAWVPALVVTQLVVDRSKTHATALAMACRSEVPPMSYAAAIYARCPDCGVAMQRMQLGKQTVLVCRRDGAWFDPGALPICARAIANNELEKSGELERAAFRDDVQRRCYAALLAHARAIGGRLPSRGPISVLAELFAQDS